ncbi:WD-40containing protein [Angomonas deanei]|uniref:methylated diphthine methylhydrolase n=1 Tax=Angomonas deanei TaxID=59799 RepID=S9VPC9_9TRYP|nr:WD-40containing protein [Angomonas deanei]EPY38032.1 WD-40containing protein [Angomonas deanei]EPY42689.1 WD-40containing protein [Angomonas deanei]CAD2212805.1 hypothetical protein, conserved [Angomonas deanei]|eukprot:EPY32437.1 WD-40containing protein [Angomonas deanei]
MCCCTDGSVRLLDPDTLEERQVYRSIHTEMLTSATPIDATTLLCTAHTGGVVLYNTERAAVTSTLEGHEFDAWCSAVTGDEGIVCSGGDDGLVKYYDTRSGTATGKIRFSAGVTSIAPVMEGGTSTPYQLVGSYDETVSLVDRRAPRRPVAQTAALGGGAWRCRTAVGKEEVPPSTVGTEGWLILPLMQRGPAILPYNVKGEESSVFDACTYFCAEEPNGDLPLLSEECLVYDMTVLQSDGGNRLLVASCSFYEKKIDLWEVTKTE